MRRDCFSIDRWSYLAARRLIRTSCVCAHETSHYVCVCVCVCVCMLSAPGETDVPLLTALLSVRPLWRTPVQQTCAARTIQLALRQSLKDPIVRGLSNYGNLINLFSSSPLTAFVSAWDLLRDLCELHPIVGVRDEDSGTALFSRSQLYFEEALKLKLNHLRLSGSVLGSFVISALKCSSLPSIKSLNLMLTGWNWSSYWPIKAGSTPDCVVVSYKRSISGWGETLSWQEARRWMAPVPFHSSPEVAFPFSLPGTFVFPAPRNKADTDATTLLGQRAIKLCRLWRGRL